MLQKVTKLMTDSLPQFPVQRLLIGASGGIGCSLLPAWLAWMRLNFSDFSVRVVLTRASQQFVSPRALAVLSGNEVLLDKPKRTSSAVTHVEVAEWADAVILAPATVNLIGKLANGISDDLLTTILVNVQCPVVVAPSVSPSAAVKSAVRRNISALCADGFGVMPTVTGLSASNGQVSSGAMADAPSTIAYLARHLDRWEEACRSETWGDKSTAQTGETI